MADTTKPTPWKVETLGRTVRVTDAAGNDLTLVGEVSDEAVRVARLMAAAPELMEALRAALPYTESRAEDMLEEFELMEAREQWTPEERAEAKALSEKATAAVEAARAALAKAEGRG